MIWDINDEGQEQFIINNKESCITITLKLTSLFKMQKNSNMFYQTRTG